MTTLRIERARRADLAELAHVAQTVHAHSFADMLGPAALQRDLNGPLSAWHLRMQARSDLFLVARRKGVILGLAQVGVCDTPAEDLWLPCMLSSGALELRRIYVLPSAQEQGLGNALLGAATEVAEQAGADMLLDVWAGNTRAQRLYARAGFVFCGNRILPPDRAASQRGASLDLIMIRRYRRSVAHSG
ncbi:GNAT family N-acetyltransferase [Isoalcanivorax indicus]|uniref:GNAT family N-acetyltransferase n=1 Tax=Isoalcanivorax indicus TaxID=2202653 RepID=UPI000DBA78E3|nr:N-acetyltransferase [Isoalcanivorax indicus]